MFGARLVARTACRCSTQSSTRSYYGCTEKQKELFNMILRWCAGKCMLHSLQRQCLQGLRGAAGSILTQCQITCSDHNVMLRMTVQGPTRHANQHFSGLEGCSREPLGLSRWIFIMGTRCRHTLSLTSLLEHLKTRNFNYLFSDSNRINFEYFKTEVMHVHLLWYLGIQRGASWKFISVPLQ